MAPKGVLACLTDCAAMRNACPARFFVFKVLFFNTFPPEISCFGARPNHGQICTACVLAVYKYTALRNAHKGSRVKNKSAAVPGCTLRWGLPGRRAIHLSGSRAFFWLRAALRPAHRTNPHAAQTRVTYTIWRL